MHAPLNFAALALLGLSNIVSALPGGTKTKEQTGRTTSCSPSYSTSYSTGQSTYHTTETVTVYVASYVTATTTRYIPATLHRFRSAVPWQLTIQVPSPQMCR